MLTPQYRHSHSRWIRICRRVVGLIALSAALFPIAVADANAQEPVGLWSDARGAERGGAAMSADVSILRARSVRIDPSVALGSRIEAGTEVQLPLFDDLVLRGTVTDRSERGPGSRSIKGRVEGAVGGRFYLVGDEDAIVGNVILDDGRAFRIRPDLSGSGSLIREIDSRTAAPCQNDATQLRSDRQTPRLDDGLHRRVDDGSLIDVYIMYTAAAADSIGGTSAMRAYLQLAIDVSNDAYELSQVTHRLRLVGRSATTWAEASTDSTSQTLNWLTTDNDNVLDEAHTLRDESGADIVALVYVAPDPCGRGWGGGTTDDTDGFNVDHWSCIDAAGGWTLVHEIGHNLGSGHDVASPASPLFSYGIGHQLVGNTGTWTTIMARRAVVGARIGYFSNPSVNFDGAATGVPTGQTGAANNRLAYANVDDIVANWRESLPLNVWVDFSHTGSEQGTALEPFNTLGEAVDEVVFGGNVFIVGGGATGEVLTLGSVKALTLLWGSP